MKKLLLLGLLGFIWSCGPKKQELVDYYNKKYPYLNIEDIKILASHDGCSLKDCDYQLERIKISKEIENHNKNINQIQTDEIVKTITEKSNVNVNIFSSIETGLPTGTIVNGTQDDENESNNSITIKQSNGINTIIRDIDVDLYSNLEIGDIIK